MSRRIVLNLLPGMVVMVCLAADDHQERSARKHWHGEYKAFLSLPSDVQERIRSIDRGLREEDSATQARMIQAMQRYGEWLDHLSPNDRKYLDGAAGVEDKIRRIREIRESQWIATLPRADREAIKQAANAEERQKLIAKLKEASARTELGPTSFLPRAGDKFPPILARPDIKRWQEDLRGKLSTKELDAIQAAQGSPDYLFTMIRLSEEHAVAVPLPIRRIGLNRLPVVGDRKLQTFIVRELSDAERKDFTARLNDPDLRERARIELVELYWKRHPDELRRIREEDEKKKREKNKP